MLNSTKLKIIFGLTIVNAVYIILIVFSFKSININLNELSNISGQIEELGVTNKKYRKSGKPFPLYSQVYFVKLKNSEELFSFPFKEKYSPSFAKLNKNQSVKILFKKNNQGKSTIDVVQIESGKNIILPKKYFEFPFYLIIIISVFALILTNYFSYKKLKKAKILG